MIIQPYLYFDGHADQAIAFYRQALDAEVVMLMRFSDSPGGESQCLDGTTPPAHKVMHACLQIGDTQVMLSDGFSNGKPEFKGVSLSVTVTDDAQAKQYFDALAQGGQVQQPLMPTSFASRFGMLVDRFGVSWMVLRPNQ